MGRINFNATDVLCRDDSDINVRKASTCSTDSTETLTDNSTFIESKAITEDDDDDDPTSLTIQTHSLNHISRETLNVDRMSAFYKDVLGFVEIIRPPITECNGVWLIIPNTYHPPCETHTALHPALGSVSMHIIHKDERFHPVESPLEKLGQDSDFPERPAAIRRSHHLALRIEDIGKAEKVLRRRGIAYHKDYLPGGQVAQLFFYDPDGNGIELGNFDILPTANSG
ncbi:Glyoxalase/Bleomycin resistance protein/Dihydroxybiphenyl dioxygenase, partial [Chytridium lagenaria]